MARRKSRAARVRDLAALLSENPALTRRQAADALGVGYHYMSELWQDACDAAGVENVRVSPRDAPRRAEDLTGRRFGRLVVLADLGTDEHGARHWLCRCDCGREAVRTALQLRRGESAQCARWNHDVLGKRFGSLVVLDFAGRSSTGDALYRCRCDCGRETVTYGTDLARGKTTSCGCGRWGSDYVEGTKLSSLDPALSRRSTTGVTGVSPRPGGSGRYVAQIRLSGKNHYLGDYGDFEEAIAVRREAEELMFDPVLLRHGRDATDEAAWREQVAEALGEGAALRDAFEARRASGAAPAGGAGRREGVLGLARACASVGAALREGGLASAEEVSAMAQRAAANPLAGLGEMCREAARLGADLSGVASEVADALSAVDPSEEWPATPEESGAFVVEYVRSSHRRRGWVTVADAARARGVSPQAIRNMIRRGRLRAEKPGKLWLIDPDSLASL